MNISPLPAKRAAAFLFCIGGKFLPGLFTEAKIMYNTG